MGKGLKVAAAALFPTLLLSGECRAQEWLWGVEYMVSSSAGDTKDFVNDFSWRNFGVEGRNMVQDNVSVGLYFGWNMFAEKSDSQIVFDETTTVSGVHYRYVNAFPIMASAHYYLGRRRSIRPYIGTGLGIYYAENRLEIGSAAFQTRTWHLGVAPEVGIMIPLNWNARGMLTARYNYGLEAGGTKLSYFTFGVGIGWL
jgi:outer membrane protein W